MTEIERLCLAGTLAFTVGVLLGLAIFSRLYEYQIALDPSEWHCTEADKFNRCTQWSVQL